MYNWFVLINENAYGFLIQKKRTHWTVSPLLLDLCHQFRYISFVGSLNILPHLSLHKTNCEIIKTDLSFLQFFVYHLSIMTEIASTLWRIEAPGTLTSKSSATLLYKLFVTGHSLNKWCADSELFLHIIHQFTRQQQPYKNFHSRWCHQFPYSLVIIPHPWIHRRIICSFDRKITRCIQFPYHFILVILRQTHCT